MWSVEDLKPSLLNDKKYIRDYAAFQIAQTRPADPTLMDRVIAGVEKFGDVAQLHVLRHAYWFPVTVHAVEPLVAILENTTDKDVSLAVNWILAECPADVFTAKSDLLRGCLKVEAWAIERMRNREQLASLKLTGDELWAELKELATLCEQAEDIPTEIQAGADSILLSAIAASTVPTSDDITRQLRETTAIGSWMDLFLTDLAGRRRLSAAAPEIVRRLTIPNEMVIHRANFALAQIGERTSVYAIQSQYDDLPLAIRPNFISALSQIRCAEAESALLALYAAETDIVLKQQICSSLCVLGSKLGINTVMQQIASDGKDGWAIDSLLLPVAELHGVELPNHEQAVADLEATLAQQETERLTMRRFDGNHSAALMKARMATPSKLKAAVAVDTIRREVGKVGRNDACSCGSGRKFKKCCGQ